MKNLIMKFLERFGFMGEEMELVVIRCHDKDLQEAFVTRWRQPDAESPFRTCNYCGSAHPHDLKKLVAGGAQMGGSDWKYGYPHKFYVYLPGGKMTKFYSIHLKDLEGQDFEDMCKFVFEQTDIQFGRDEKGFKYSAPVAGYQRLVHFKR